MDVGCGPGSLTLLLAPHFERAIGVDADADMLREAARLADEKQVANVVWRHLRGEDRDIEYAILGRLAAEMEYELLDLIARAA